MRVPLIESLDGIFLKVTKFYRILVSRVGNRHAQSADDIDQFQGAFCVSHRPKKFSFFRAQKVRIEWAGICCNGYLRREIGFTGIHSVLQQFALNLTPQNRVVGLVEDDLSDSMVCDCVESSPGKIWKSLFVQRLTIFVFQSINQGGTKRPQSL